MLLQEFIKKYPDESLAMMTPGGYVSLTPKQAGELLSRKSVMAHPGDPEYAIKMDAEELLSLKILNIQRRDHVCHMLMDYPEGEELSAGQREVEGLQEMEKERKLKERIKANYEAYIQQLKQKPASDLIEMAAEIAAARIVYEEITMVGGYSEYADYLLQFENPLEAILDQWTVDQSEQHEDLDFLLCYMAEEGGGAKEAVQQESDVSSNPVLEQGVIMC